MTNDPSMRIQIYLLAEAGLEPETLAVTLDAGAVACVLLRGENLDDEALQASIQALRPVAQATATLAEAGTGVRTFVGEGAIAGPAQRRLRLDQAHGTVPRSRRRTIGLAPHRSVSAPT